MRGSRGARGLFALFDLAGHTRRLCAGADRIREHVHLREGAFFDEGERPGKLFLRLAGKAGDEIGRECAAGEGRAQPLGDGEKLRGRILPAHARERFVAPGLHGEMEVRADVELFQALNE